MTRGILIETAERTIDELLDDVMLHHEILSFNVLSATLELDGVPDFTMKEQLAASFPDAMVVHLQCLRENPQPEDMPGPALYVAVLNGMQARCERALAASADALGEIDDELREVALGHAFENGLEHSFAAAAHNRAAEFLDRVAIEGAARYAAEAAESGVVFWMEDQEPQRHQYLEVCDAVLGCFETLSFGDLMPGVRVEMMVLRRMRERGDTPGAQSSRLAKTPTRRPDEYAGKAIRAYRSHSQRSATPEPLKTWLRSWHEQNAALNGIRYGFDNLYSKVRPVVSGDKWRTVLIVSSAVAALLPSSLVAM